MKLERLVCFNTRHSFFKKSVESIAIKKMYSEIITCFFFIAKITSQCIETNKTKDFFQFTMEKQREWFRCVTRLETNWRRKKMKFFSRWTYKFLDKITCILRF